MSAANIWEMDQYDIGYYLASLLINYSLRCFNKHCTQAAEITPGSAKTKAFLRAVINVPS